MNIDEATRLLTQKTSAYHSRLGEAKSVLESLEANQAAVTNLDTKIMNLDKIAALLNTYADARQEVVQGQIEAVVTSGLRTIFGEDLTFRIDNRMVGRRSEIDFVLVSQSGGSTLETSILDARGGGVAAVAGFLLQATMVLLTPDLQNVLFLDETFSQVSENYLPDLSSFIRELTDRTDLQVVMVTHSNVFEQDADTIYRISQVKGVTQVEEVK